MKKTALILFLLLSIGSMVSSQSIPIDSLYFGQVPPGNTPQLFAPGIVSMPGRNEALITFSPDGQSVFFYIEKYPQLVPPYILYAAYTNNHWTTPDTIPFSIGRSAAEPFFSYSNNRLYLWATDVINQQGTADISYSEKQGNNWSNPVSLGNPPNSESYQYHPCIVGDTSLYFSSGAGRVCRCQYNNGVYESRIILPRPINYIGSQTWGDPFVSKDETYMIIKAIREEGYGQNDIYISYRRPDLSWTNPKNLGNIINTPNDETSGDITPDGLYMTYGSNKDLFWVSTSFIDSLKYTNYLPYVKNLIPDQTAYIGQSFTYSVPDSTFFDDDGNNTLSFDAMLTNGDPLPSWLTFDTISAKFEGTPITEGILNIKVIATDTAGASASTPLKLHMQLFNNIDPNKKKEILIYPNPTGGVINIFTDNDKQAFAEVCNHEGKIIKTMRFKNNISVDLAGKPKGLYMIKLFMDNDMIIKKICLN